MLLTTDAQAVALKAKLFQGLADQSRLRILEALRAGALTVSGIVEQTGLSQSNVSNHLGCLRDCGLVSREQQGRFVHYRLTDARVATMLGLADGVLADVATGVYQCTRYETEEGR